MPLQPAVLGSARLNNFRLNYLSAELRAIRVTRVGISIGGVRRTDRVLVGSLRISDVLNDAPNTCGFTYYGDPVPQPNQKLVVTLNSDDPVTLFAGTLQTVAVTYVGRPSQVAHDCSAIDDTAQANRRRPFGSWTNISATTVAIELVTTFAPALSTAGIETGLPLVTVFFDGSEGMSGAFAQLAKLVGGYFKFEEGGAYLFTELTDDPCDPIDAAHPFLNDPPISSSADVSQLRTRQCGRGHGETVPVEVAAGAPIIPVADVVMFDPVGGLAIAGTTPDGAPTQRIAYTGVQAAAVGTLVGPGVSPSVAPSLALAGGSGLSAGVYHYAYTWVTASGSTLPSPLAAVTTGDTADPSAGPTAEAHLDAWSSQAGLAVGDVLQFALSFSVDFNNTVGVTDLTVGGSIVVPAWSGALGGGTYPASIYYTATWIPPVFAQYAHVWISKNGAPYRYESTSGAVYGYNNPSLVAWFPGGGTPPAVNRSVRRVNLSGIAIGPAGTTARRVYRTTIGGALKLQQVIANNTATVGVQDATPDGSLGAAAPTSDTAGLTQTAGQVNAGSTSIPTAGAGSFSAAGGWIKTSSGELVRYAGISGNTLTGIPASGAGAILTSVLYGSIVMPAPALTGVTGLAKPMERGTPVHIWVERNDTTAQATQAAIDAANGLLPADGVYEGQPIVDERRGIPSLTALCDATLAIFATPIQTVRYATRDLKTKSGKPVTVDLASPPITADLVIQDVQITEIDIAPGLAPKFEVTASSTRFSLDSLLRKLTKALGV